MAAASQTHAALDGLPASFLLDCRRGGAFSVLFIDNVALHPHSWRYILTPGVSGGLVLLLVATLKVQLVKLLKGRQQLESKKQAD